MIYLSKKKTAWKGLTLYLFCSHIHYQVLYIFSIVTDTRRLELSS